jgi:hypothetical protein
VNTTSLSSRLMNSRRTCVGPLLSRLVPPFHPVVHGLSMELNESHPSGHQLGDLSAAKI